MITSPPMSDAAPSDAVDELADDEHEPVHPDDVEADDGEDVGLLVVVADDDVARQVHHARHHARSSRPRRGRRPARPVGAGSVRAAQRRPASTGAPEPDRRAWSSRAIVRGSGRMRARGSTPTTHIAAAANHGTTSVSSSRSFPAKSGRKTSGPSAAPKSAPKSTYEIARALRLSGYMSAAAVRARRTAPFIAPTPTKPRMTSGAESDDAAERGEHAADHPDHEPAGDHGDAAEAIHQAPGRERRERAGREEDRRARGRGSTRSR